MTEAPIDALRQAVEGLHGCTATYREAVTVTERFRGQVVWDGVVSVFAVRGLPGADTCYAWSYEKEPDGKRRFYAVLKQGPVDAPEKAVRAAIVQDFRVGGL